MKCYRRKLFSLLLSIMLIGIGYSVFASDDTLNLSETKTQKRIGNALINQPIRIMPQFNKLNFGFGRVAGAEYYFTKTISRIFFQDVQVEANLIGVEFGDDNIVLELSHPILGYGQIEFVFGEQILKGATEADIQDVLLNSLGSENHLYVFSNPGGKIVHMYTCNHLSDPDKAIRMTLEHAEKKRYKKCGFCFKKMLYLPDLSLESSIEREWSQRLSDYHSMLDCTERQVELQKLGGKILDNWPFPLLGYEYSFHLVASQDLNAFAIPTGQIVVTSGILDSLENDEELEALLVLAIAHVEKRHSLKQYRAKLAEIKSSQQLLSLVSAAGSIVGAVAGGLWGAVSVVPLDEETEFPKPVLGFQDVYESEAAILAALYFDIHLKNKENLITLIRKLQFNEMTELFHPDLKDRKKLDLEGRIKTLKNTQFLYFGKENRYKTEQNDKAPYELDLLYQHILGEENKLDIYITDKRLLKRFEGNHGKQKVSLWITDKTGRHEFSLDKQFTTEDTWGVFLTFSVVSDQRQRFLKDIETIVLKIAIPAAPSDRVQGTQIEDYIFVEGKLEYDD